MNKAHSDFAPLLSVVVLCYKSGETIVPFVHSVQAAVQSLDITYELVLVGNYLPDGKDITKDVVERLAADNKYIIAIAKPKQGMMGWDMRSGLKRAKGKYICVIDGDGQFPVESIVQCYHLIIDKQLDFVKTYRDARHDGTYRWIISKGYNLLFRLLFPGLKSQDVNSKPKIFTREAYEQMRLTSDDWFIDAEIMLEVRRNKMTFDEFPFVFLENRHRKSFVKTAAILEFTRNLIKYRVKAFRQK